MHPIVGPIVESQSLYVAPSRLEERLTKNADANVPLVVFDVGLGAGSNAICAWKISERLGSRARRLVIVSFDRTAEAIALASNDTNASAFGFQGSARDAVHTLLKDHRVETARTSWRFVLADLPHALSNADAPLADIIFWDPFSPSKNPEMWNVHAFTELARVCQKEATVHTYSAATATRSSLLLAGFSVGVGPGTHDGKETTIACYLPSIRDRVLERPLDRRWLDRLARSSLPFAPDAPNDALDRVKQHPQFA
jgi:queuine tRNA-ribosyltransferase